MRILVGTLYTIENEFKESCASIRAQTYADYEHVVIRNLPNKEAHDTLYRMFEKRADEFELMIKVDADMVIDDQGLFEKIVEKFKKDPQLDWVCIKVQDFYCNRMIWGLNAYRNTVRWKYGDEHLFVDLILDYDRVRNRIRDEQELAPAASHCKNPSPFQAFHFGVHRGLKCAQPGRVRADRQVLHWKILLDVFRHYDDARDIRLAYTIAGIELALMSGFDEMVVSCENNFLPDLFRRKFEPMSARKLEKYIMRKRLLRLAQLPYPFDFGFVYGLQRLKAVLHKTSSFPKV